MFWKSKKEPEREEPMTKSERAQTYSEYLRNEGYAPSIDQDGDVKFKKEGGTYYILISEQDQEFFRLVFPSFWPIESEAERKKAEMSALKATTDTKVAKIFLVKDNVWGAIELFCASPDHVKAVFPRCLSALKVAVETFTESMRS